MANISTYFPSGGGGATGGGIEGTNKFTIKAGGLSIPAGWPVSFTQGDKTIEKTQGDPALGTLANAHSVASGIHVDPDPYYYSNNQTCYFCQAVELDSTQAAMDITVRMGQNNYFRLTKSGLTGFKNKTCSDANNCTDGLNISCFGMQNICYDESNLCLTVLNTGYVVECACNNSNTTFNCAAFCWCHIPTVPFYSYTSKFCNKCCYSGQSLCCTFCQHVLPKRTQSPYPQVYYKCCSNTSGTVKYYEFGTSQQPYETTQGAMVFKSCDCSNYYVAIPTQRAACFNSGCCAHWTKRCYATMQSRYQNLGHTFGMMLWKFDKCTGKDELCTNPTVTCNMCGCWGLGNLTKNGNLMYGVKSKATSTATTCNCLCLFKGCEFFFVEEMDSNVSLNPVDGCIASTNREFNYFPYPTCQCQGDICVEGERKLWPMTEDPNGWVLWTEPVEFVNLKYCSNNQCYERRHCGAYMRVGAFKPTGQGAGTMTTNVVCMCYNAATSGAFCIAGYNGVTGACTSGFLQCADMTHTFAGDCTAGQNFGDYMVFADDHPAFHTKRSVSMGIPKRFFCSGSYGCMTSCCGFLPQGAIHTACYDSASSKQFLIVLPMWHGGTWTSCQTRLCCGSTVAVGSNVCFQFTVNNSNNTIALSSCSGSLTDITCFRTAQCSTINHASQWCVMPCDIFKFDNNLRLFFVTGALGEHRPRPITLYGDHGRFMGMPWIENGSSLNTTRMTAAFCQCWNDETTRTYNCCSRAMISPFPWSTNVYQNTMAMCPANYAHLSCTCVDQCFSSCALSPQSSFNVSYSCSSFSRKGNDKFSGSYDGGGAGGWSGPSTCPCCFCVGHSLFPFLYHCEDNCLCHNNKFCVYTRCKATGAITACNLGCYFSTLHFMPQSAEVIGPNCHTIFFNNNCTDGTLRYSIATAAGQNNSCQFMGFAAEAGNAGDTISIATVSSGTAPLHACLGGACVLGIGDSGTPCCFRLQCQIATIQRSTGPTILCCFNISNPQSVNTGSKAMSAYRSCVCISFDPATSCCKLFMQPMIDVC